MFQADGKCGKMKRIMLTISYDGTAYSGWQIQSGRETIEGVLNRCIFELTGERVEVIGASRTDAGVHALGNIAVLIRTVPFRRRNFLMR